MVFIIKQNYLSLAHYKCVLLYNNNTASIYNHLGKKINYILI